MSPSGRSDDDPLANLAEVMRTVQLMPWHPSTIYLFEHERPLLERLPKAKPAPYELPGESLMRGVPVVFDDEKAAAQRQELKERRA